MHSVLILADEKRIRDRIRSLLSEMPCRYVIAEASDLPEALSVLRSFRTEILIVDRSAAGDALEEIKKESEETFILAYTEGDPYAEALLYGGRIEGILDPPGARSALEAAGNAAEARCVAMRERVRRQYLGRWYLQRYLYGEQEGELPFGETGIDQEEWGSWHYAILIESTQRFFDSVREDVEHEIRDYVKRDLFYLNLSARQSLLLFKDTYCDYKLIANTINVMLRRKHTFRFYLAVSRKFEDYRSLPEVFGELDALMDERFYRKDCTVFSMEENDAFSVDSEAQDSLLLERIAEDISRKDMDQLEKHFTFLKQKYQINGQYSAMYVKFVFSNVLQELFAEDEFRKSRNIETEIGRLYQGKSLQEVISVIEDNIESFEKYLKESMIRSREKIRMIQDYITEHCGETLTLEKLADIACLSPGYLSFIYRKETGISVGRYIKICRMDKARRMLAEGGRTPEEVVKEVGFSNLAFFCRTFREYFGMSIEEAMTAAV